MELLADALAKLLTLRDELERNQKQGHTVAHADGQLQWTSGLRLLVPDNIDRDLHRRNRSSVL